jgi:hypothetical protein
MLLVFMLRASRSGSEDSMNCCGRKPNIFFVYVQPVSSTRVIITFRCGFEALLGCFWEVKVAAAEDKA